MAVPAYAKPAIKSMKVLAKTKKNTPEAKAASVIVGKRMRSLRRRNALWAGALALAAVGGVAAYKHQKGTLQLPSLPEGTIAAVRNAATRATTSTVSTFRSAYTSIKTLGRKPAKSTVMYGPPTPKTYPMSNAAYAPWTPPSYRTNRLTSAARR